MDKQYWIGRDFSMREEIHGQTPDVSIKQLDSVEGTKAAAVLLSMHFTEHQLHLAFLRLRNNFQSVIDILDRLYLELENRCFH